MKKSNFIPLKKKNISSSSFVNFRIKIQVDKSKLVEKIDWFKNNIQNAGCQK